MTPKLTPHEKREREMDRYEKRIKELYDQGLSLRQIAHKLDKNPTTIQRFIKRRPSKFPKRKEAKKNADSE